MYIMEMAQLGAQPVVIYDKTKCLPNPSLLHHYINAHRHQKQVCNKTKRAAFLNLFDFEAEGLEQRI